METGMNAQPKIGRANNGAPLRSLDGAVAMYQRGMNIRQIALALGYVRTAQGTPGGTDRIARLLEAAGLRKRRSRK
jgi:hypothetical protein